ARSYRKLENCLIGQPVEVRNLASVALLNTFIDTLILLIGVAFTEKVLDLAWNETGNQHCIDEFP
ncbi:MAG: hypothetical protein WKG03_10930, partial [Telluria sp.]